MKTRQANKYKENDIRGLCKCGHSHVYFVEDLGENEDEAGYDIIPSCCYCRCENFKRGGKNGNRT